jgi:chemotaxis protein methyltransferase CheR
MLMESAIPGSAVGAAVDPQREFAFSRADFGRIRKMILAYAGISLHEHKGNMVYNRLARRVRATGASNFRDYLDEVERPGSGERERFVNALTTNLTGFFREPHHFERLARLGKERSRRTLHVWSSACSTGEEAYSAAIALREAGIAAEIFATDVDSDALAKAQRGVYRLDVLERIGSERVRRHFLRGTGENAGYAMVRPELRATVKFNVRNLLADDWPPSEGFDAIFCRNVMIYFDRETQLQLLDRLAKVLAPGGILFLGHSENCAAGHAAFVACGKTSYERRHLNPA